MHIFYLCTTLSPFQITDRLEISRSMDIIIYADNVYLNAHHHP
jgi:hypothetical protein